MKPNLILSILSLTIAGFILRVVFLTGFPAGFNPDEAAWGYNAYSLLQTGRDEWGMPWYQLFYSNLRSFGDYRFPLYAFLTVPAIRIFGLTEFATRLPNALLGTLSIPVVYLLAHHLFHRKTISWWSALLLCISPWHISLSRGAFETNSLVFLFPLAIYCYLSSRYKLSALFFGLNIYTYIAAKLLTPPVIVITTICKKTTTPIFWLIIFLVSLPGIFSFIGISNIRVADVSIFNPTDKWQAVTNRRYEGVVNGLPDPLSRLFSNKYTYSASLFIKNYLSYFSPQFLFTQGAGENTYGIMSGRGLLYYFQLPFLVLFIISAIRHPSRSKLLLFGLIVIAPLAAALSKGPGFAANRSVAMLPFLAIASAVGISYIRIKSWSKFIIYSLVFLSVIYFVEDYIFHSPSKFKGSMNYGWKQAASFLAASQVNYSQIRVSRSLSEPHIYIAFYLKIPPRDYQLASVHWADFSTKGYLFLDQYDGYTLGKYRFGNLNFSDPVLIPTLFVGRPQDLPIFQDTKSSIVFASKTPNQ